MRTMRQVLCIFKSLKNLISSGLLGIGLLAILGACSTYEALVGPEDPEYCPKPGILAHAGEIHRFRDGAEKDPANIEFEGKIVDLALVCDHDSGRMDLELAILFDMVHGPANEGLSIWLEYFAAYLNEKGDIVSRETFRKEITFESAYSHLDVYEEVEFSANIADVGKKIRDHKVLIGFRLKRDEIEYNRNVQ